MFEPLSHDPSHDPTALAGWDLSVALINATVQIDQPSGEGARTVGVTAGASAPEVLVQGVIDKLSASFDVTVEEIDTARETVTFKLPRAVA